MYSHNKRLSGNEEAILKIMYTCIDYTGPFKWNSLPYPWKTTTTNIQKRRRRKKTIPWRIWVLKIIKIRSASDNIQAGIVWCFFYKTDGRYGTLFRLTTLILSTTGNILKIGGLYEYKNNRSIWLVFWYYLLFKPLLKQLLSTFSSFLSISIFHLFCRWYQNI